ncbi:unnamed protein product [Prorocentrum cordatum]|uniref:Uncharacterized protein n=1 Tax=Prorocentrum cordatum TaxID=2364126 RepID=A0ABN9VXI8_9DINO|nr:unnamed protein product [Polarella glacialis]
MSPRTPPPSPRLDSPRYDESMPSAAATKFAGKTARFAAYSDADLEPSADVHEHGSQGQEADHEKASSNTYYDGVNAKSARAHNAIRISSPRELDFSGVQAAV